MAFYNPNNPYFPMNYYAPNYPGYATQGQPTQSGDFVPIPSEEDARNFPIQRGTYVTYVTKYHIPGKAAEPKEKR